MVDQLNDDELRKLAEFLRARKKPDATPKDDEPDAQKAEIVKVRKILLNLALGNGIDEKTMRMRAEAYIEKRDGAFTNFDDMTLDQLNAVKVNYVKVIKDGDQAI